LVATCQTGIFIEEQIWRIFAGTGNVFEYFTCFRLGTVCPAPLSIDFASLRAWVDDTQWANIDFVLGIRLRIFIVDTQQLWEYKFNYRWWKCNWGNANYLKKKIRLNQLRSSQFRNFAKNLESRSTLVRIPLLLRTCYCFRDNRYNQTLCTFPSERQNKN
jgi:hypothetical protein